MIPELNSCQEAHRPQLMELPHFTDGKTEAWEDLRDPIWNPRDRKVAQRSLPSRMKIAHREASPMPLRNSCLREILVLVRTI